MTITTTQGVVEQPLLRGKVSITDFDLILFLAGKARSLNEIAGFLQVAPRAANVYLTRLRQRRFLSRRREAYVLVYFLSEYGKEFINQVRERIGE